MTKPIQWRAYVADVSSTQPSEADAREWIAETLRYFAANELREGNPSNTVQLNATAGDIEAESDGGCFGLLVAGYQVSLMETAKETSGA